MKNILKPIVIMLFAITAFGRMARSEVIGPTVVLKASEPVPPITPPGPRIPDGPHMVDNGTPSTFYDAINGVWLAGAVTSLYKLDYLTADVGVAAPVTGNSRAEFVGAIRFHAGEFLIDKVETIRAFVMAYNLEAGILKYATAGLFTGWDNVPEPSQKSIRFGPFIGIEYQFK